MKKFFVTGLALTLAMSSLTFAAEKAAKPEKKSKEEIFKSLDTDASGAISKAEFTTGKEGKKLEAAEKQFAKMDKDSNGEISKEEFVGKKKAPK